jgi:hypothetical protein
MPSWKEEMWRACSRALRNGGEVKIIFMKRQEKVIPTVYCYVDNYVRCDEETILEDD